MKNFIITFLIILFSISLLYSQEEGLSCLTSQVNKIMEEKYPMYKTERENLEKETQNYLNNPNKSDVVYVIPIVFHIVHKYGSENISKAQIEDAVRILNEDFRKLNTDTNNIVAAFKSIAADSKIEFRLAQLDPDGNCTEGITRVYSELTVNADDNAKYVDPIWPRNQYMNIWVVKSVSGAAGYAYYPSSWSDEVDGVIINHEYVGSIGTGSATRSRALTHEIGHSLNLSHTWGNSNDPGLEDNCNDDDGVADTPNTIGWTTCLLSGTSCGSLDNVQNYMEYSYCTRMYTTGQKARMRAALESSTASRSSLWQSSNLIATGTNDGYVAQACTPLADFSINLNNICYGNSVQYSDLSYNGDLSQATWSWSFPGGNPSTSSDVNPTVLYNSFGNFDASLTVTNQAGSAQITKTSIINVFDNTLGEEAPFSYGFENSSFPINNSDANKSWDVVLGDSYPFQRNTSASSSGSASVRIRNYGNAEGTINSLLSPNIVMPSNLISSLLTFKVAYAKKTSTSSDNLKVYLSSNCGQTWGIRYSRTGTSLSTNGGALVSNTFTPNSSQWREETITMSTFATAPNLRIKFEITSNGGNYLYIDDINLSIVTSDNKLDNLEPYVDVFPNPITSETKIAYSVYKNSEIQFILTDLTGRILGKYLQKQAVGNYDFNLNNLVSEIPNGVYILTTNISGFTKSFRLVNVK
ncbi:MAG: hypothetical protein A2046_14325 [Bacteroidetes bacterium GWA2_30_7]|nr:MAG: hypothetical protein A2046_14325 [Bacteroidetes bacterium GWA2_30_7]